MASPAKPRRPWYRPHISTCVVTALVALFFGFWNVAGYYREREPTREASVWVYGWPAPYLERSVQRMNPIYLHRIDDSLTWRLWNRATNFFPGAFSLDLAVAGAGCLLLGGSFEACRRRRAHLFQIYLSELGILTAIVCGVLGGGRYLILSSAAEDKALRSVRFLRFEIEAETPEFLHERLPGTDFKPGDLVTGSSIHDQLTESQMEIVCRQHQLRKLEISSPLAANVWQKVVACRRLEEIELGKESLQDADLQLLTQLPRLKKLNLSLGSVKPAGLRHVGQIKTLDELTLIEEFFAFVTTESLEQLSELPLTKLDLHFDDSRCGECELTGIGNLKNLRDLSIANKQFTTVDVAAMRKLVSLEGLTLYDCEFESAQDCETLFRSLTNLRSLALEFKNVPPGACQAISDLDHLESLYMRGPDSFYESTAWVSRISTLRQISYYNYSNKPIDEGIARLVALPNLEHLEFYCDGVTDKAVDTFVQIKSLKTLKLTCDHLSPAGTTRLEKERPDLKVTYGNCY